MTKETKLHSYLIYYHVDEDLDKNRAMFVIAKSPKEAKEIVEEVWKLRKITYYRLDKVEGTRKNFVKEYRETKESYYERELKLLYDLRHHIKKGDIL